RQDSSFLYYFGIDQPGLAAAIDVDENKEYVFGNDLTIDDIVWMGPQPTIAQRARKVGAKNSASLQQMETILKKVIAQGRTVHYLPQYRADNILKIEHLLGIHPKRMKEYSSEKLIMAVASQRVKKSAEELKEIEAAVAVAYEMQTTAMRLSKPGMSERMIAGIIEGIAVSHGGRLSFPAILSVNGQTLHNHYQGNKMKAGDIVVNDSGAETAMHYASDITRTFPVSGKFTALQKDIYQTVLDMQMTAIKAIKPGIKYKSVHLKAAKLLVERFKDMGFMKGNTDDAVKNGAHALFFPHGLGHLMGLDVHDMENLGEGYTGYNEKTKRSSQFGLAYLRFGKEMEPGVVLTVEPGIYFIPELIDLWKKDSKFKGYINYEKVLKHKDFHGIRIEDDVVVTQKGYKVLGKPIPKTVEEVEELASMRD
ncbi:MAG: aminopeptidase P family protein, partial [Ignavibacteriaceae bacterium]